MICTINRATLADALSTAARVAAIRSTIPVGQSVRLDAKDGTLSIAATDFDHWLNMSVECEGDLEPTCVHAGRLSEVISNLYSEYAALRLDAGKLLISGNKGKRTISTVPADEFPAPTFEPTIVLTVPATALREALLFTLPHIAPSDDVTRRNLAGLHLKSANRKLKAVGTDRFNLAVIDVCETESEWAATVAPKVVELALQKMPATGDIEIALSSRAARISWPGTSIRGPLIEDAFPDFARILPDNSTSRFSTEAKTLAAAVRGVCPLGTDDRMSSSKRVKLTLNGHATVSTTSIDGEATEDFEADLDCPNGIELGFASSRMEKMLKCFGDSVINIGLTDPNSPMRIEAAGKTDRVGILFTMRI